MRLMKSALLLAAIPVLAVPALAQRDSGPRRQFRANLAGASEVPVTLTGARGRLLLTVNDDDTSVHFVLEYQGLETHVTQSHIHVGQPSVNGNVTVFFCDNINDPPKAQPCPEGTGTVEGDFTADEVGGITSQQLPPHDLARLLAAIRAGETYANLHTADSPAGEIRAQIRPVRPRED